MIPRAGTTSSAAATTNVSPVPKRLRLIKRTNGRLSNSAFYSVVFSRIAQRDTREIITITVAVFEEHGSPPEVEKPKVSRQQVDSRQMFSYDGRSLRTANEAMGYSQMEGHEMFVLPLGEPDPTNDFEKENERRGLLELLGIGKNFIIIALFDRKDEAHLSRCLVTTRLC